MSTPGGSITAYIQIDTSKLAQQAAEANRLIGGVGKSLQDIPSPQLKLPTEDIKQSSQEVDAALRVVLSQLHLIPGAGALAQSALLGVGRSGIDMGTALGGAAAAGLVAFTTAMVASTKAAIELEYQVASIKSIKFDLDTQAASDALRSLSAQVGQSSTDLAKSLYNIYSSVEISQGDALKLLEQFSKGAVAAQTDAKTFGTALIGVLNAYKLSVDDAAHVSDVFFNTVKAGVVTGEELARGLGPVTQSAKQAGVSIDELGGLIAGVSKEGGDAAENFTRLNNLLAHLVTKETAQQFAALGISVEDANGKLRSPIAILTDLKARLEGMTAAAKANALQEIFPEIRARQGAQVIISQLDFVNQQVEENRTKVGAAGEAYQTMAQTSKAALDRLKESVGALASEIGDTLTPSIAASASGWAVGLDAFRNYIAEVRRTLREGGIGFTPPAPNTPGTAQTGATALGTELGTQAGAAPRLAEVGGPNVAETEFAKLAAAAQNAVDLLPQLGEKGAQQFFDAFAASLHQQAPKVADELNAIVHQTGSDLAGVWATATGDTTAQEAALFAAMEAKLRELLPGMGDAFYTALQTQVIAKAKAAFDGATDITATFVARLRDGLADVGEIAQAVLQKKINLDTQLASTAQTEAAIAAIFEYQKQLKDVDGAITNLTDRGIAAHIKTLLNQIATTGDAAEAERLWGEVVNTSRAQIAAQTATQADATRENQRAVAAVREIEAAIHKAAEEGGKLYNDRLNELASTTLPSLTAAETVHLRQMQDIGDQQGVLTLLTQKTGKSQEELQAILQSSNVEFAKSKQAAEAYGQSLGKLTDDQVQQRIGSALGTLADGVNASVAALAKQQQAAGDSQKALETLAGAYGASKAQADQWAQALQQGGAAAQVATAQMQLLTAAANTAGPQLFALKEQLSALTTFARDPTTNQIKLKVEIDIQQAQQGIAKLQQDYQETFNRGLNTPGSKGLLGQELQAQTDYRKALDGINQQWSDLSANALAASKQFDAAWHASAQQLTNDIQAAVTTSNTALQSLAPLVNPQIGIVPNLQGNLLQPNNRLAITEAVGTSVTENQILPPGAGPLTIGDQKQLLALHRAIEDLANQKQEIYNSFAQTLGDATESHTKALQSVSDTTDAAIKSAGEAQASALRSLSSAMQQFNDQQAQAAANASITLQNAQLAAAGLDASTVGGQTNQQRLQLLQQQGLAALQQQAQANQLNQARVSANVASNQAQDQLSKAFSDAAKQLRDANESYAKSIGQASGDLAKGLYALQQTYERQSEDQELQRKEIAAAQKKAIEAAQEEEAKRAKQLKEQQEEFAKQQELQAARLRQQQEELMKRFQDEEADRARQREEADKRFREELLKQARALEHLVQLLNGLPPDIAEAIAARLQLGPQQITQNIEQVAETAVDFADYLGSSLLRRVRAGV